MASNLLCTPTVAMSRGLTGLLIGLLFCTAVHAEQNALCGITLSRFTHEHLRGEQLSDKFHVSNNKSLIRKYPNLREVLLELQGLNLKLAPIAGRLSSVGPREAISVLKSVYYTLLPLNYKISETQLTEELKPLLRKTFTEIRTQIFNVRRMLDYINSNRQFPVDFDQHFKSVRDGIKGEIGELAAALVVPAQNLKRSVVIKNIVPEDLSHKFETSIEVSNLLGREIDVSYTEESEDGSLREVWTEIKNNDKPVTTAKVKQWLRENTPSSVLVQIPSFFKIKKLLNHNGRVQIIFMGGITHEAIEMLQDYFGQDVQVYSGVSI